MGGLGLSKNRLTESLIGLGYLRYFSKTDGLFEQCGSVGRNVKNKNLNFLRP